MDIIENPSSADRPPPSPRATSSYFTRTTDFVLVYKSSPPDSNGNLSDIVIIEQSNRTRPETQSTSSRLASHSQIRAIFESNLAEQGLHLTTSKSSIDKNLRFVKISATWSVLTRCAEIMKLEMKLKNMEPQWSRFVEEEDPLTTGNFSAAYDRDKEYLFDIPTHDDRGRFFSSAKRGQIIDFLLTRTKFSINDHDARHIGINKLLKVSFGPFRAFFSI